MPWPSSITAEDLENGVEVFKNMVTDSPGVFVDAKKGIDLHYLPLSDSDLEKARNKHGTNNFDDGKDVLSEFYHTIYPLYGSDSDEIAAEFSRRKEQRKRTKERRG